MKSQHTTSHEAREIDYLPAVSIMLPLQSSPKNILEEKLKFIICEAEKYLKTICSNEKTNAVMKKLIALVKELNIATHKRSLVILVSPVLESIYYLDAPVEERIEIDQFFEARDKVFRKKSNHIILLDKK